DNDDDESPNDDDDVDNVEKDEEDKKEEEHLASADPSDVSTDDLVPSREMLHICPRLPCQTFDEFSFEEEILAFLRFLRDSGEIRKLTDVNINKLHQP
nr:hypothetical protein [Tanacetum cinerariifolium]